MGSYQNAVGCPAGNYMFKVNNRSTRARCEIFSKLAIKIPEQRHWSNVGNLQKMVSAQNLVLVLKIFLSL